MKELMRPTAEQVRKCYDEMSMEDAAKEKALNILFSRYPNNTDISEILLEDSLINFSSFLFDASSSM